MKLFKERTGGKLEHSDMIRIAQLLVFAAGVLLVWKYFDTVIDVVAAFFKVLSPFLVGGAIAFVLNVPMRSIEKLLFGGKKARSVRALQKMARPVSLVLTLLFVAALLALFFGVLVPRLSETVEIIAQSAQEFFPKAEAWIIKTFEDNPQIIEFVNNLELNWEKLASDAGDVLQSGISTVVTSGVNAVVALFSGVVNAFIGLIFACYVLVQKEKLGDQAYRLLHAVFRPRTADNICGVGQLAFNTFSSFVRGQCLEAAILGLLFVITMPIFGLPYPLMVGVIVTFTALIPIFGAFIGCAVGAFLILMVDPLKAVIFVIMFLVLQQIEGNFIYPKVVGNSVGLPSIWVLVAVTVGGNLMGVLGMLLFIPLGSVGYALLRSWVNRRNALRTAEAAAQQAPMETRGETGEAETGAPETEGKTE